MPIIKSARKRARQTTVRQRRNEKTKQSIRDSVKAFQSSVDAGKLPAAKKQLSEAFSAIDTAVKKNLIHKNRAARQKSRLHAMVRDMKAPAKKSSTTASSKKSSTKSAGKSTSKA